jgi:hypothetical protein
MIFQNVFCTPTKMQLTEALMKKKVCIGQRVIVPCVGLEREGEWMRQTPLQRDHCVKLAVTNCRTKTEKYTLASDQLTKNHFPVVGRVLG